VAAYEHAIRLGPPLPRRRAPPARPGRRRHSAASPPHPPRARHAGRVGRRSPACPGAACSEEPGPRRAGCWVRVDIDAVRRRRGDLRPGGLTRAARAVHRKPRGSARGPPGLPWAGRRLPPLGPGAGRPSRAPPRGAGPGAAPPSAPRISHWASSPSARGLVPRSCRHSACRAGLEHRDPGSLPPGKLTASHRLRRPAMPAPQPLRPGQR